eukprot:gene24301-9905_t
MDDCARGGFFATWGRLKLSERGVGIYFGAIIAQVRISGWLGWTTEQQKSNWGFGHLKKAEAAVDLEIVGEADPGIESAGVAVETAGKGVVGDLEAGAQTSTVKRIGGAGAVAETETDRDRPRGQSRSPEGVTESRGDRSASVEKRARLEAWKARMNGGGGGGAAAAGGRVGLAAATAAAAVSLARAPAASVAPAAWTPWVDDSSTAGAAAADHDVMVEDVEEEKACNGGEEELDPLDAFMANEVAPEVKALKEEAEKKREAQRIKLAERLAAGKQLKIPKILIESDSEDEPDVIIQIPTNKVILMVGAGGLKIGEIQKKSKVKLMVGAGGLKIGEIQKKSKVKLMVGAGGLKIGEIQKKSEVKLMVGAGGLKIGEIQKKSKAKVQIQKETEDLTRAFGSGPKPPDPKPQMPQKKGSKALQLGVGPEAQAQAAAAAAKEAADKEAKAAKAARKEARMEAAQAAAAAAKEAADKEAKAAKAARKEARMEAARKAAEEAGDDWDPEDFVDEEEVASGEAPPRRMTTVHIFGDQKAAVNNKEQKQKQRAKEYERKREDKRRTRQLYHLRHSKDYDILELPMGASKADIKKAYRKLAMIWHPDKHQEDPDGVAKKKFQDLARAYESLMSTDEEDKIEQIAS